MTTPVSFELAKLLKEKGFDKETNDYFLEDGIEYSYPKKENWNLKTDTISQPTITDVVMWLYEKRGIWIVPSYELAENNISKEWFWIAIKNGEELAYNYGGYKEPTEAYEAAILHCLTKLI